MRRRPPAYGDVRVPVARSVTGVFVCAAQAEPCPVTSRTQHSTIPYRKVLCVGNVGNHGKVQELPIVPIGVYPNEQIPETVVGAHVDVGDVVIVGVSTWDALVLIRVGYHPRQKIVELVHVHGGNGAEGADDVVDHGVSKLIQSLAKMYLDVRYPSHQRLPVESPCMPNRQLKKCRYRSSTATIHLCLVQIEKKLSRAIKIA